MNETPHATQQTSNAVKELSLWFKRAHIGYLRAQIDEDFKDNLLPRLRRALDNYESVESSIYDRSLEENLQNLLLRLRGINVMLEGYFWIGAIKAGSELAKKYSDLETWIKSLDREIKQGRHKSLQEILSSLSMLSCFQQAEPMILRCAGSKRKLESKDKRRIISEVIRIGVNLATINYYPRYYYKEAIELLDACATLLDYVINEPELPHSDRGKQYGLKAQISYFSGCCYRQMNYLLKAEELFTQCLSLYVKRIEQKYAQYIEDCKKPNWVKFHISAGISRYRTAIILAARADLNYRKGLRSVALNQNLGVAQIILGESADVINRAYVRMQSAIISRELATEEESLKNALRDIGQSQGEFERMEHQKYIQRAIYEQAYSWFYLARFYHRNNEDGKTQQAIYEALKILENLKKSEDRRWKAQYLILESRLLVLQKDPQYKTTRYREAEKSAEDAIDLLRGRPNHVTYLIEALIAKSRAMMEGFTQSESKSTRLHLLESADKLLYEAWLFNQNRANPGPSNYKIETIIHFVRARIKVRMGQLLEAKKELEDGKKFSPNIESEGVKQLGIHADREVHGSGAVFILQHGLDLEANKKALETYLIEQAYIKVKESEEKKKPWDLLGISKSSYFEKRPEDITKPRKSRTKKNVSPTSSTKTQLSQTKPRQKKSQ
ncbi:MAG: hypothetical protein WBV94_05250 [Blastocatellia bacterium]